MGITSVASMDFISIQSYFHSAVSIYPFPVVWTFYNVSFVLTALSNLLSLFPWSQTDKVRERKRTFNLYPKPLIIRTKTTITNSNNWKFPQYRSGSYPLPKSRLKCGLYALGSSFFLLHQKILNKQQTRFPNSGSKWKRNQEMPTICIAQYRHRIRTSTTPLHNKLSTASSNQ